MPVSALPTELVQIAYTVPDLEAACREWAVRVGAGPFLIRSHLQVVATHNGEPAIYDHSAAFGQWGPLMLELVQLHECSPAPLNEAFRHSAPNEVNHYAYFVEDLEASTAALEEQGFPLMMELIEIYVGNEHLRAHYARVAALAEGWDGSDPVRYM